MFKQKMCFSIVLLLFLVVLVLPAVRIKGFSQFIYVDDDNIAGPWYGSEDFPFQRIQVGILFAGVDDTIFVKSGIYRENIVIAKRVILQGENKDTTIIDGNGIGNVITLTSSDISIHGFTIKNGGTSGISISSDSNNVYDNIISTNGNRGIVLSSGFYNQITNNVIENNNDGILLNSDSGNSKISNNTIRNNLNQGISCHGRANEISCNIIQNNQEFSITVGDSTSSFDNSIIRNTIKNSIYGVFLSYESDTICSYNTIEDVDYGIDLSSDCRRITLNDNIIKNGVNGISIWSATDSSISENTIFSLEGYGVFIQIFDGTIFKNTFKNTDFGIRINTNRPTPYIIRENIFEDNSYGIFSDMNSQGGEIFHNTFRRSSQYHAYEEYPVYISWDDGYPSGGNYWDDYSGSDLNGDGIGDTAYDISGGNSQDENPLLNPYDGLLPLQLLSPEYVIENVEFQVFVTSFSNPVTGVKITFNSITYTTNSYGVAFLQAPVVTNDTTKIIRAEKQGYRIVETTITIRKDESSAPLPELTIHTPLTVQEKTSFEVTITKKNSSATVSNVSVSFNGENKKTNMLGKTSFVSPEVDKDRLLTIIADKDEYTPTSMQITVINIEDENEQIGQGWICGVVTDNLSKPISNADICIIFYDESGSVIYKCKITDVLGRYNSTITVGTYSVQAQKQGYVKKIIQDVKVTKDTAVNVDFILEKERISENKGKEVQPIDYVIQYNAEQGNILGKIDIQSEENQNLITYISTYLEGSDIGVLSISSNKVSLKISGPVDITNKIVSIQFGPGTLYEMKNIRVLYDNELIEYVNFETFFANDDEINQEKKAVWTSVDAIDSNGQIFLYCLIKIPHFSEHTITIYTIENVIKTLSSTTAFQIYLIFCIIIVFFSALHLRYVWKK